MGTMTELQAIWIAKIDKVFNDYEKCGLTEKGEEILEAARNSLDLIVHTLENMLTPRDSIIDWSNYPPEPLSP